MNKAIEILKNNFSEAIIETSSFRGDEAIVVDKNKIAEIGLFLRDHNELKFQMLMDICGVDYLKNKGFLEVVYHLYSPEFKKRIRIKTRLKEKEMLPSVHKIWKAANWFEREAFDLFGICFDNHPNLKRLLTYEGFKGHALLKDYPIDLRQEIPKPDKLIEDM
ncbi:MAG: NADH-quinone oxidoreductase subunit C [Deltaproteobacteria bacterium CG07_land_8_20_14_0_80_38_7]|nr:MAG: NADH-quinone oxidoreductase subunit C [Deltaproteobacteria bacterium CG07_land_8_20_14_0_80_38_7]